MIDIPPLWQFMVILVAHFVGDFVLQTHWQATNKSQNNYALLEHVCVYTLVLGFVTGFLFGWGALWFAFVWINAVLHFCTDWVTSRAAKVFFAAATWTPPQRDPGPHWHNFFVVLGLDQLIHGLTLGTMLWLIVP